MLILSQENGLGDTDALRTAWRLSMLGFNANARRSLKAHILPVSVSVLCQDILDQFQHDIRSCSSLLHGASLIHKLKTNILMEDARLIITRLRQKSCHEMNVVASISAITQLCEQTQPEYLMGTEYMEHWAMVPKFTFGSDGSQKKRKLDCVDTDTLFEPLSEQRRPMCEEAERQSIVNAFLESNEIHELNDELDFDLGADNLHPITNNDANNFDMELEGLLEVESLQQIQEPPNNHVSAIQSHSITNDPDFGLSGTETRFPVGIATFEPISNNPIPGMVRHKRLISEAEIGDTYLTSHSMVVRQSNYYHGMSLQPPIAGRVYEEIVEQLKTEPIRLLRGVFKVFLRRPIPELNKQVLPISATVSHLEGMNTELEFERRMQQFEIPHDETEIGRNLPPQHTLFGDEDTIEFALDDINVSNGMERWDDDVHQEITSDPYSEIESFGMTTRAALQGDDLSAHPHAQVRLNRFMCFLKSRCAELHLLPQVNSRITNITFAQLIPNELLSELESVPVQVSRRHAARSFASILVLATDTKIEIDCKKHRNYWLMTGNDVIIKVPQHVRT